MNDTLQAFLTKVSESISALDLEMMKFEQHPNDPMVLDSILELVHMIKSTCGYLDLLRLEHVARAGETALGRFREGRSPITPEAVQLILKSLETIKSLVGHLEQHEREPEGSDDDLIAQLEAVAKDPKLNAETDENSGASGRTITIGVEQVESLMATVSELVLTRNQILQIARGQKENPFAASLQRLSHVTSELQEGIMKTRMQPIGHAWAELPEAVRDVARRLNKKVDLRLVGAQTEVDRQVLETIRLPLLRMVTHAVAHAIELPSARIAGGKPEAGAIHLRAFHEGGYLIIEVADDGSGEGSESLMPGLKGDIEKMGGAVDFRPIPLQGSRFTIKIPLTLAIVSALVVESAGQRFAIPQISVVELVQVTVKGEHRIEQINNTPVLRLRDHLLPLVPLRRALGLDEDETQTGSQFIAVIQAGNATFGIIVDRVYDTEEIVVKPVSPALQKIKAFSGSTVLGDGSVVMILDLKGLAGEFSEAGERVAEMPRSTQTAEHGDMQSFLLFEAGAGAPKAVPLSLVARLEEIGVEAIEFSGGNPVTQYRGRLMPLVSIDGAGNKKIGRQSLLVFADGERTIGLMVDRVIDIVKTAAQSNVPVSRPGFLGTAIISGKATDLLDVGHYLAEVFQDSLPAPMPQTVLSSADEANESRRIA